MKRICLFIALVVILLNSADVYSQTTHAHASSRKWHGINVQDILKYINNDDSLNAHFPKIKIKQTYTYIGKDEKGKDVYAADEGCGIPIYLYNVGTGKFVIEGGDWGMEGRLFYEDFGRRMKLILEETEVGNGNWQLRINPHITEDRSADKCRFAINVPTVTRKEEWEDTKISKTTIMDGFKDYANWDFERVEDTESDYYTFRMSQKFSKNSKYDDVTAKDIVFRLGAAYGEWRDENSDKGTGYYVHIDDDRSCWTSAGNSGNSEASPWGNKTKVQVGSDMVEIDELYQWRIISEEEFITVLNEEVIGLNPSISSLVPDRDFTRNSNEFQYWHVGSLENTTYSTDNGRRYGYTWGYASPGQVLDKNDNQNTRYKDAPWNEPVMLKKVYGTEFNETGKKQSKFGFMSFEGQGTAYVRFEVPHPGWYSVEANTINFSPEEHPAYFYALADGAMERPGWTTSAQTAKYGYQEMPIKRLNDATVLGTLYNDIDYPSNNLNKGNRLFNLSVGEALTKHGSDFRHEFWIYIDPDYYYDRVDGIKGGKGLTIGIKKEHTTQKTGGTSNSVKYYYDSDWVVMDDIKISYMGLAPAFLYEEEENLDYLVFDEDKKSERPGATPDNKYSGSLSLARTMKKDKWNSFSMPLPLTGEQVRYAFGEDARLLELHSIGGLSENSNIIDFQSVELKPADPYQIAVEPGKFYLLKPTADPVYGLDPKGDFYKYYQLGRTFFTVNPIINKDKTSEDENYYTHYIMNPAVLSGKADIESWQSGNNGESYVSYVQTPGYSAFRVDASGKYDGVTVPAGTYAIKGSYVISDGKVVEINKDTRLKGFRGWIKLSHSLFHTDSEAKISINGVVDEDGATGIDATAIVPQRLADDTAVYDLGGRKVGTLGTSLPKGIYIVKGKKFMVN